MLLLRSEGDKLPAVEFECKNLLKVEILCRKYLSQIGNEASHIPFIRTCKLVIEIVKKSTGILPTLTTGSNTDKLIQAGFLAFPVLPVFPYRFNGTVTMILAKHSSRARRDQELQWRVRSGFSPRFPDTYSNISS